MMLSYLTDLLWLAAIIVPVFVWRNGQSVKQHVRLAMKQYCRAEEVMLLDDSIVLQQFRFKGIERGRLQVQRRFGFEFTSTGEERYDGWVEMLGRRIEHVELEPYRIHS